MTTPPCSTALSGAKPHESRSPSREEERTQVVRSYVLCSQKKHGLERTPDLPLMDCTFDEAQLICKVQNANRIRGNRLCVVPLDKLPPEQQALTYSSLTPADLLEMHYSSKTPQRRKGEIYLSLRQRMLKPRDALAIVQLCQAEQRFDLLGLSENFIGDEGLTTIASHLDKSLFHIRGLFMSENKITAQGVEYLASVLPNSSVIRLGLNFHPGIGCRGAVALSDSIALGVLTVLGLTECEVKDGGCKAIAEAIGDSRCRLERIFLNRNHITNSGADVMATNLCRNRTLRRLGLAKNQISSSLSLLEALEQNLKLERLCLFGNVFPDQEIRLLAQNSRVNLSPINHRR